MCATNKERPCRQYEKTRLIRADAGRGIRAVLDRIGDKWTLLIVATLHERRMRFTELQSSGASGSFLAIP